LLKSDEEIDIRIKELCEYYSIKDFIIESLKTIKNSNYAILAFRINRIRRLNSEGLKGIKEHLKEARKNNSSITISKEEFDDIKWLTGDVIK
jgi:hypothetical protein